MSECLSKKAVLEWLESEMSINKGHPDDIDIHWTLNRVSKKILSGAFDADNAEIQRLRAALTAMRQAVWDELVPIKLVTKINKIADEALSTTTEPTAAERVREYYRKLEELRNRTKYRDAATEYEQRMTDICNVLDFLGITIPGINATEKEENA